MIATASAYVLVVVTLIVAVAIAFDAVIRHAIAVMP